MPDLVRINQFRTLATNVELLEADDCTMTEAYKLLKNMRFLDDPCSIPAYIKKPPPNSDLETINKPYQLGYCSNHLRIVAKSSTNLCYC